MSKRKWITKIEAKEILKMYSVRPEEFVPIEKLEHQYKSKYAKGYVISIRPEELRGKDVVEQTGRIIVQHCDANGNVRFTDVWEREKEGKLQFFCRQPKAELPDSASYVNDLRQEIERLRKQLLNANTDKAGGADLAFLEGLLDAAVKEKDRYRKMYEELKNNPEVKSNAGRKKRGESDATKEMLEAVWSILEKEPNNKEPWETLGIGRATFFRYKKLIQDANK